MASVGIRMDIHTSHHVYIRITPWILTTWVAKKAHAGRILIHNERIARMQGCEHCPCPSLHFLGWEGLATVRHVRPKSAQVKRSPEHEA